MFSKKSREDKDYFAISFHYNNAEFKEYIPKEYSDFEYKIRENYLTFLAKLQAYFSSNFYYWHLRHLMIPRSRKSEDLNFMAHVYNDHDGIPTNKREKYYYKHLWKIYGNEFSYLYLPKIMIEEEGDVVTHPYVLAYYKRWVRKPRPNMKRLYHGVSIDELGDVYSELRDLIKVEKTKINNIKRNQKKNMNKYKQKNKL